jgi:hypothetical protein
LRRQAVAILDVRREDFVELCQQGSRRCRIVTVVLKPVDELPLVPNMLLAERDVLFGLGRAAP